MEGRTEPRKGVSLLLVLVMTFSLLPGVQAQSGEVLLDAESFSVDDYASFEGASLPFTVELHEQSGATADVNLTLLVNTLEGTLLSSTTQTVGEMTPLEERNVSAVFENLPFGFSEVTVLLEGDVGANTSTHMVSLSRTVQRLRPLAITLGGPTSVVANPVDHAGVATGNLSLHDGDRLQVDFPIINNGDVNWTGDVALQLLNEGQNEHLLVENVTVNASSSHLLTMAPALQLVEGHLAWSIELLNVSESEPGTHELNGTWEVGPPPLPVLEGALTSDADAVRAGETLTVALEVWNNGTVTYTGDLHCSVDDENVFTVSSSNIGPSTSMNWSFEVSAKPLDVVCTTDGQRVSASSGFPVNLTVNMPSAVFESAGSTLPSFSGGPWHKGDTVGANMLLRNTGSMDGRVRMVLSSGASTSPGEWVEMSEGAAGEVSASLQFLGEGETELVWALESDNGLVSGVNSGASTFVIKDQQSVQILLSEIVASKQAEIQFSLELVLDEGKARDVRLQVGYETGGTTVFLQENDLQLQAGKYQQSFTFGDVEADRIVAQISPLDWLIGPGPLAATASLPDDQTQFWVEFSPTTNPIRPVQGDDVTLQLTFHQSGPNRDVVGDVWLVDAYGSRLTKVESPAWGGESSQELSVVLTWPKGSNVALQVLWNIDGTVVTAETTYISGEEVAETSDEWPVAAVAWGLVLGGATVLLLRLRARRASPSTTKSPKPSVSKPTSTTSDEKREISCPECDRRLRVPVDYQGSVGCPDCSHKFKVEPEAADQPEPEVDDEVEVQPTPASVVSEKIEISCPDCSQTLRIPSSYTGSVRCPACTKIFKAHEGKS